MIDIFITVKGYYALAQMWEEEAEKIFSTRGAYTADAQAELDRLFEKAEHCRNQAAKLEGRTTTDKQQRHMGEIMADF